MGSSRLPNKVMQRVLEKPLLGWMLDRVALSKLLDDIIVATTVECRDDVIVDYTAGAGFKVHRGSEDDVLDRYYEAACKVGANTIVRLTADCPLIDSNVIDQVIKEYLNGGYDFVSNTEPLPSSWPDGMDVSVFSFDALKESWEAARLPSEREHVTFHFWNNSDRFRCKRIECEVDLSCYRLTVDYAEDLAVVSNIIEAFGQVDPEAVKLLSIRELIRYLEKNIEVYNLNKHYYAGIGWKPSFDRDKAAPSE